jgi:hypothetical protein
LPPTSVEARSIIGYRVAAESEVEDLYSIALRFTPTFDPVPDTAGLAKTRAEARDECKASLQILGRVCKRVDADSAIRDDGGLLDELIEQSAALLALARFDEDAYREWARQVVA